VRDPTPPPDPAGDADHNHHPNAGPQSTRRPGLRAVLGYFLGLGTWGFGGPIATVGYMQRDLVERRGWLYQHHWLTQRQFLDAVAMGLITPGPVVITAAFIGYLVGGFPGSLVATVAIFTPIYLGVVLPGRWFLRHKDNPQVKAFVNGATAAAAGAIAGATVVLTRQAITDLPTALIALVSLGLLWRFKVKEPLIVLAGAIVGLVLH
jgi:chromate transporter